VISRNMMPGWDSPDGAGWRLSGHFRGPERVIGSLMRLTKIGLTKDGHD